MIVATIEGPEGRGTGAHGGCAHRTLTCSLLLTASSKFSGLLENIRPISKFMQDTRGTGDYRKSKSRVFFTSRCVTVWGVRGVGEGEIRLDSIVEERVLLGR